MSDDALTDHAYTFSAINALLPPGRQSILHVGCGNGFIAGQLAALGHKVLAVDISDDGIAIARMKSPRVSSAIRSIYDGLCDLTEPVDVVISSEVIEHLYYPKRFPKSIPSTIRTEGYLILTPPYHG